MDNVSHVLRHQEVNLQKPEQAASVAICSSKETANYFVKKMVEKLNKLKREHATIKCQMQFFKKGYTTFKHAKTVLKINRLSGLKKDPDCIKWLKDAKQKRLLSKKIKPMKQFMEWQSNVIQVI